jgi:hypothetical protein
MPVCGRWKAITAFFYSFGGAQPQFYNSGTLRKNADNDTTSISSWAFVNSGTVDVQMGSIQFDGASGSLDAIWMTSSWR